MIGLRLSEFGSLEIWLSSLSRTSWLAPYEQNSIELSPFALSKMGYALHICYGHVVEWLVAHFKVEQGKSWEIGISTPTTIFISGPEISYN